MEIKHGMYCWDMQWDKYITSGSFPRVLSTGTWYEQQIFIHYFISSETFARSQAINATASMILCSISRLLIENCQKHGILHKKKKKKTHPSKEVVRCGDLWASGTKYNLQYYVPSITVVVCYSDFFTLLC